MSIGRNRFEYGCFMDENTFKQRAEKIKCDVCKTIDFKNGIIQEISEDKFNDGDKNEPYIKKVKRLNNVEKNTLSPEILNRLYELAEEGHKLTHDEKYMEAIYVWNKAIELIPEPRQNYFETANFYEGIAYNYQMMNLFPQALYFMDKALNCWGEEMTSDKGKNKGKKIW